MNQDYRFEFECAHQETHTITH